MNLCGKIFIQLQNTDFIIGFQDKIITKKRLQIAAVSIFHITNSYFNPARLSSNVAILARASASFCLSIASTFSGALFTNFSLLNFA